MAQDPETTPAPAPPRGRLGLFLPYIVLLALAVLWSGGWLWARARANAEADAWLAREAAAGRTWTCADRAITGYPFRLELRCASVALARADGGFRSGPVTAVVQIYDPRHVILQAQGPFQTEQGDLAGEVTWTSLGASFHGTATGFSRADLVAAGLTGRVAGGTPEPITFTIPQLELHARPDPGRFTGEGAVDVSLRVAGAAIPQLDRLAGTDAPTDVALDAVLTRATGLGTGTLARELERWRTSEGSLDITQLAIAKGEQRLRAKGEIRLDDRHRPAGVLDLRAAGLEGLVGQIMGERFGRERGALIGNLVGQLLGGLQRRAPPPGTAGEPGAEPGPEAEGALRGLPPLRLADGRLMLGPLPVPNVAVPPLY